MICPYVPEDTVGNRRRVPVSRVCGISKVHTVEGIKCLCLELCAHPVTGKHILEDRCIYIRVARAAKAIPPYIAKGSGGCLNEGRSIEILFYLAHSGRASGIAYLIREVITDPR